MAVEYRAPGLQGWDVVVVILYFLVVVGVGVYAMFKTSRSTVSGYFLAGRFMTWLPIGASIFASNIGSEHFIGLAGSGAAAGIGVGAFELNAMIMIQLLGWVFAPVYIAAGVCTMPEYIKRRFGGRRLRVWLSVLALILYVFTKISVNLFSGALFIRLALGWNLYLAILLLLFLTCICTITGGLAAVIYTDTLSTFLMVSGSLILMAMGFREIGGYGFLERLYMQALSNDTLHSNSTCGRPPQNAFIMLRDPVKSDIPWPGFILGQSIASVWYWCADQVIVQRALAAKSLSHAQGGCIFAGYIKILPLFTLVMPGMISRILSPDRVACSVPEKCMEICGSEVGCTNIAYPELVLKLMPTGLRGLMMAVMMAALMSDLTSIFNSASTLFTIDVYSLIRKKASVRELMIVGRIMVAVMTGIGVLWIPVVQNVQGGQLFLYIQQVQLYFCPPIASVYLIAILWKKATEKGAFIGMTVGFIIGAVKMVVDFSYQAPRCGEPDQRPGIVADLHYMYFAMILFWITTIVILVISAFTKPLPDANISRLTWWTCKDEFSVTDHLETNRDELDFVNQTFGDEKTENHHEEPQTPTIVHDGTDFFEMTDLSDGRHSYNLEKHDAVYEKLPHQTPLKRLLSWFCGYEGRNYETKRAAMEHQRRMATITSLEQDRRAKMFLNINLIAISCICVSMFVYFSI
ncbi:sodium/glucose cotransporter 5-like [Actinia tenebrosa]|uniref:Sodium/myo-inositol cotransporter n=1 Tax=Actinia tenebrosa TaxID=6105 RepID=A0A6P8HJV3_ACTTE|nr:sodium/glucose cotransporter 5-like [Actinia tenebrosa]